MKYKHYLLITLSLFAFKVEAQEYDLDASCYAPGRCGLNGVITVRVKGVKQENPVIKLADAGYTISHSALPFQGPSTFVLKTPGYQDRPLSSEENQIVKARISAWSTSHMAQDAFQRLMPTLHFYNCIPANKNFNKLSLEINSNDGSCSKNAWYGRTGVVGGIGSLSFCSQGVKMASLFDVVAHETSHALLDALNPTYYTNFTHPALSRESSLIHPHRALHEFFGDWGAIYTSCDLAIIQGKESEVDSYLRIGKGFCLVPGWEGGKCFRSLTSYEKVGCEAHDKSVPLTHILVESMRETYREVVGSFDADHVMSAPRMVVQHFNRLVLSAVAKEPAFDTLRGFAGVLLATQDEMSRTSIARVDDFIERSFLVNDEDLVRFYSIAKSKLNEMVDKLGRLLERCSI